MQRYCILDREIGSGEEGFETILARAHALKERALCLCRSEVKLPLYIAARSGGHVLARWPGSGARHAPDCDHFDAPGDLTGLGQLRGLAVIENEDDGEVSLRFGFPLSRGPARAAPGAFTNEKPSVRSNGQKLSMRGLLHFLWDRAELTHWHPKMAGKRTWFVVRRALAGAALGCTVGGQELRRSLFVPETFQLRDKDDIEHRRRSELGVAHASRDAIMVVVGEIKSVEAARYGEKILVRHLPGWPFLMDETMARRFHARFAVEEELWRSSGADGHMVMAASFAIGPSGLPQLFEIAVMPVTGEWLPYESIDELALLAKAVGNRRRFVKGLRYNLGSDTPIASLALKDTGEEAVAVHLGRGAFDAAYDEALREIIKTPGVAHCLWQPGDALPPARQARPDGTAQASVTLQ